jgi:hypothetical protein
MTASPSTELLSYEEKLESKAHQSIYSGPIIRFENEPGIRLEAYLLHDRVVDSPPHGEPDEQLLKTPRAG